MNASGDKGTLRITHAKFLSLSKLSSGSYTKVFKCDTMKTEEEGGCDENIG
jgi:hypothetical protein